MSPEEIIATIAHSGFPTVVTEGDGDVIVLRRLEERFLAAGLTLIAAGGRDAVISVFNLRHQVAKKKVIFIADRDLWVLTSIPSKYISDQFLFTDGYSIENDMFIDGRLESLLTGTERHQFDKNLEGVCKWFALAASRHFEADGTVKDGATERLAVHPRELLDDEIHTIQLMKLEPDETYPVDLYSRIQVEYRRLLRGKTLLELLVMHSRTHKYSYDSLLNFAASREGPLLSSLFRDVAQYFGISATV